MRRVSAQFGARSEASAPGEASGAVTKVYDETKDGDNVNYSTVNFDPGSVYLLFRTAWTIGTGSILSSTVVLVTTQTDDAFGSAAVSHTVLGSTSTQGFSLSWTSSGTLQWRCSNATTKARIRLFKFA